MGKTDKHRENSYKKDVPMEFLYCIHYAASDNFTANIFYIRARRQMIRSILFTELNHYLFHLCKNQHLKLRPWKSVKASNKNNVSNKICIKLTHFSNQEAEEYLGQF